LHARHLIMTRGQDVHVTDLDMLLHIFIFVNEA